MQRYGTGWERAISGLVALQTGFQWFSHKMRVFYLLQFNWVHLNMKIPAILTFLIAASSTAYAQFEPFFPIGAESWITEYNANGPPIANYRIYVEEDTVIDGLTYTKMMRDRIFITPDETQTKLIGCFRELDGVITFYDTITHTEYEYFDQNATVGDTIASVVYPYDEFLSCDYYRYFVIDSLADTTIAGVILKHFFLNPLTYDCTDEYGFFWNSFEFIEEIGFLGYPTQWYNPGIFDGDFPGLIKCYEDDQLGLVKFIEEDCDFLETAIMETEHISINIFPNPADAFITVQFPVSAIKSIRMMNNLGALVLEQHALSGTTQITLQTAALAPGIYWVGVEVGNTSIQLKPIIIE